jgi:hypothetical protein
MVATMNTPTVQKQFTIESNIPYVDLRSRACANLDLDPSNAELGYRVSGAEGPKTLPSSFDSEDDHSKAMDRICKFISRSRTKEYGIEIVNLVRRFASFPMHFILIVCLETGPQTCHDTHQVQKACS